MRLQKGVITFWTPCTYEPKIEIYLGTASKLNRRLTAGSGRFRAVRPGQMFVLKYEYAQMHH